MSTQELTIEKVIDHHLKLNLDQKLTPHLIAGLVALIGHNIRNSGVIAQAIGLHPANEEIKHD